MKANYVEAPAKLDSDGPTLFLGGGITDCPDWQKRVADALAPFKINILNPRRANFPIHDPTAAEAQITWEHQYLRRADLILFWFPKEALCPIVLYELGAWSMTPKPICVGVERGYKRAMDVEIQTKLVRPDIKVAHSLEELITKTAEKLREIHGPAIDSRFDPAA
jgi:hypothetical protein